MTSIIFALDSGTIIVTTWLVILSLAFDAVDHEILTESNFLLVYKAAQGPLETYRASNKYTVWSMNIFSRCCQFLKQSTNQYLVINIGTAFIKALKTHLFSKSHY